MSPSTRITGYSIKSGSVPASDITNFTESVASVINGITFTASAAISASYAANAGQTLILETDEKTSSTYTIQSTDIDKVIVLNGTNTVFIPSASSDIPIGSKVGVLNTFTQSAIIAPLYNAGLPYTASYPGMPALVRSNSHNTDRIRTIATQSDGKILLGGSFRSIGGVTQSYLARLNTDFTLDTTFAPVVNNTVYDIHVRQDGSVVFCGNFTTVGGQSRTYVAKVDSVGNLNATFTNGANGLVRQCKPYDNEKTYVLGGDFTTLSGTGRAYLGMIDATNGFISSSFASLNIVGSTVNAVVTDDVNSTIYFGGTFSQVGGLSRTNAAACTPTGTTYTWAPVLNNTVNALLLDTNNRIAIGGTFTTAEGLTAYGITRYTGAPSSTTQDPAFFPNTGNEVFAIAQDALTGDYYVAGLNPSNSHRTVRKINNVNNALDAFYIVPSTNGTLIYALLPYVSRSILVGLDPWTTVTGVGSTASPLVQLPLTSSGDGGTAIYSLNNKYGTNAGVRNSILDTDGSIYLAGEFTDVDGVDTARLSKIYPLTGKPVPFNNVSFNGSVFSIVKQPDDKLLIGGAFTRVNQEHRKYIVRLNRDGTVDTSFTSSITNNAVRAIMYQTDNTILVGGAFTQVSGSTRNYITKLNNNGTLNLNFYATASSVVNAFASMSDGNVFVGGEFSTFNGATYQYFTTITGSTGLVASSSRPTSTALNSFVYDIKLDHRGRVLVAGLFTSASSQARLRVARYITGSTNLTLDTDFLNPNINSAVNSIALQSDTSILVAGNFTTVTGSSRSYVARLNYSGSFDTTFNLNPTATYLQKVFVQPNGNIIVAGDISSISGSTRRGVARFLPSGLIDDSFDPNLTSPTNGYAIEQYGNEEILIGGNFGRVRQSDRAGFAFLESGALHFNSSPDSTVNTIVKTPDNRFYIGGAFSNLTYGSPINGTSIARSQIAVLSSSGYVDTAFSTTPNSTVTTIELESNGRILVGGNFTTIGRGTALNNRIARLRGDGSTDKTATTSNTVQVIRQLSDGTIFIGGDFTTVDGYTRTRFAKLNAQYELDTGSVDVNVNSSVIDIETGSAGKIYLGGAFTSVSGSTRSYITRLNSNLTIDAQFYATGGATVRTIRENEDGTIWVGGDFTTFSSRGLTYATLLNQDGTVYKQTSSVDYAADPNINGTVLTTLQQSDGKYLIGGSFTSVSGSTRNFIARLNRDLTIDTVFYATASSNVRTLVTQSDGKIIIGGDFVTVNGVSKNYLARLNTDGTLDTSFITTASNAGQIYKIAVQPDQKLLVGGNFTAIGTVSSSRIARLNSDGTVDTSFTSSANSTVQDIAIQNNGNIFIGGLFTQVSGSNCTYFARLSSTGRLDPLFSSSINNGVYAIGIQSDDKVVIGGNFTSVSGSTRNSIARLNNSGSLDSTYNPNLSAIVRTVAITSDNKTLVGGDFTTVSSTSSLYLNRLNENGTVDRTFDVSAGNAVHQIVQSSGSILLLGGTFTNISGLAYTRFAAISSSGATPIFSAGVNSRIYALRVQPDGKILVCGNFTSVRNAYPQRSYLARFNADWTLDSTFDANTNAITYNVELLPDNKIMVMGNYSAISGSVSYPRLTRLNSDGTIDTTFTGSNIESSLVYTMTTLPNGDYMVGGNFNSVSGSVANHIVRLTNSGSINRIFSSSGADNLVYSILYNPIEDNILVGGSFTRYDALNTAYLVPLRTTGSIDIPFINLRIPSAQINKILKLSDGNILIGGAFTSGSSTGSLRNYIIKTDASGNIDTTFNLNIPTSGSTGITSIVTQSNGDIIIGGQFARVSGSTITNVARITPSGVLDTSFNLRVPQFSTTVQSLKIDESNNLFVGGSFESIQGIRKISLAKISPSGLLDEGFDANITSSGGNTVRTINTSGSRVFTGGDVYSINGHYFIESDNRESIILRNQKTLGSYSEYWLRKRKSNEWIIYSINN